MMWDILKEKGYSTGWAGRFQMDLRLGETLDTFATTDRKFIYDTDATLFGGDVRCDEGDPKCGKATMEMFLEGEEILVPKQGGKGFKRLKYKDAVKQLSEKEWRRASGFFKEKYVSRAQYMANYAVKKMLKRLAHEAKEGGQPFAAFVSFVDPGPPWRVKKSSLHKFEEKYKELGFQQLFPEGTQEPENPNFQPNPAMQKIQRRLRAVSLMEMDAAVQMLVKGLGPEVKEQTALAFLADNGAKIGSHGLYFDEAEGCPNCLEEGFPHMVLESAAAVPFFIKIPNNEPQTMAEDIDTGDVLPTTIRGALGIDFDTIHYDGVNALDPAFAKTKNLPRPALTFAKDRQSGTSAMVAVVYGKCKGVFFNWNRPPIFYDLEADPFETDGQLLLDDQALPCLRARLEYLGWLATPQILNRDPTSMFSKVTFLNGQARPADFARSWSDCHCDRKSSGNKRL